MMNKRVLLAFFISLLVIIGYNYIIGQKYPPPPLKVVPGQLLPTKEPSPPTEHLLPPEQRQVQYGEPRQAVSLQTKDFVVETELMKVVITSGGARIKSCQLKQYPEERLSATTVQSRIAAIDQALRGASAAAQPLLQREKDKLTILLKRIKQKPQMAELVSLAAAFDHDFSPAIILPNNEKANRILNTALYQGSQDSLTLTRERPSGRLEFTFTDAQGRQINKVYSFSNSNYSIGLDISFYGWQKQDLPLGHFLLFYGPDLGMPQAQRGRRTSGYQGAVSCFQTGQQSWVEKEKYSRNEKDIFVHREHKPGGKVLWAGLENKYFLSALIPQQAVQSVVIEKNNFNEQKVALSVPWIGPGPYNFKLYLGPKQEERLRQVGVSLDKVIDYGVFGPIARLIYRILVFFSRWTHNFGWAIVLLCLITKIVFYPLTHRSFESMQKMQREMKSIQPEMNALREKLKDNPQKLNKDIMELYRKKGINPLASCQSGCLPMILQMPVFFALYAVLYNSIELRGEPFLGWITDLSAKDPLYILPVLMGVSMFAQQKLMGMGAASGAQQEQAKMMSILMPVMLTWIFASLPSGVVLYWFTFNIVTALQQLFIRKRQEETT